MGFDEAKIKRDEHGRFSESGVRAMAKQKKREREETFARVGRANKDSTTLYQKALKDGGFTYDAVKEVFPSEGYSVSSHPEHERIIQGELTQQHLDDYIADKRHVLEADDNAKVGAWHDSAADRWYLDISHVTTDRDEAVRVAKHHNQEAIYDLGKRQTVFTKDQHERRGLAPQGGGSADVRSSEDDDG